MLLVWAAILALRGLGLSNSLVWPLALVGAGAVLLSGARSGSTRGARALGAFALVVVGVVDLRRPQHARDGVDAARARRGRRRAAARARAVGLAPRARARGERAARIRTEERADFAARVHDSVLQTLTLIQKEPARRAAARAPPGARAARVALSRPRADADGTLADAVESAAAEIEELHGVRVDVVRTGDAPLDERAQALVLAAREAMANAARHSGVDEVSVFLDAGDGGVSLYVRDRGSRVRPGAVAADRRGLAESIRGRMERVGGTATIVSAPGEGHRRGAGARHERPLRRVVLVDDHDLFRAGVRAGLDADGRDRRRGGLGRATRCR